MRGREPPEPSEAAPAGAWPAVAAEGPAGASAATGRSFTSRISGSAIAIIRTPSSWSAVCQP